VRTASLVVSMVLAVSCIAAQGAPEILLDRTACARCGMLISELTGAASYRMASGETRAYDDLACLLGDLSDGVGYGIEPSEIWVHDRVSEAPLRASEATFVRSQELRTPMGGGFAAFAEAGAAAAFSKSSAGEVLRWADVMGRDDLAPSRSE
jgi:copper chaperone NosL